MGSPYPPLPEPFAVNEADIEEVTTTPRHPEKVEGPSPLQWAFILTVCIVGGYWLATAIYNNAVERDAALSNTIQHHHYDVVIHLSQAE